MSDTKTDSKLKERPKVTPLFVSDPGEPSKVATLGTDLLGRPVQTIDTDSAEAASHWDRRHWRSLRNS